MLIRALKYINSIPFGLTIRHYQSFGDSSAHLKGGELRSPEAWDELRLNHPHFSVPQNRAEWLEGVEGKVVKDGQDKGLETRAKDIAELLRSEGIHTIFSVGVGGGGLEYHVKKQLPEVTLVCSEYAPQNVTLLQKVFSEANEITRFDMLESNWSEVHEKYFKDHQGLLLMYRVDVDLTDEEWRQIFKATHAAGIETILFIPSSFLSLLSLWNRKKRELGWMLRRAPVSFAGHLRTKKRFQTFWKGLYSEEGYTFGGTKGFLLKIK